MTQNRSLLVVSGIAAMALAGGVGWWLVRDGGSLADEKAASTAPWPRHVVESLSIEAPFSFGAGPNVTAHLPEEVRAMIVEWKTREGVEPATGMRTQVSHIIYRDTVPVDLDGAAEGAMTEVAAAMGDQNPDFKTMPLEISGLAARRVSYQGTRPTIYLDAIFIQRGPHLWQVQTVTNAKSARAMSARILESVQLAVEPPPTVAATPAPAP